MIVLKDDVKRKIIDAIQSEEFEYLIFVTQKHRFVFEGKLKKKRCIS